MTEPAAFAVVLLSLVLAPTAAWLLARRGGIAAGAVVAAGFAGIVLFLISNFRPDLVAGALGDTGFVLLYPAIVGAPAAALLVALGALTTPRNRRGVVFLAAVVAGYAAWQASYLVRDPAAALGDVGHWQGDCYFQSTNWSCAPSAACSVLKKLGIAADEAEMARLMRSRPHYGTNTLQIRYGLARKLAGAPYRVVLRWPDWDEIVATKAVGVAAVKLSFMLDHAVALVDASPERVVILDPLVGRRELPRAEFENVRRGPIVFVMADTRGR